MHSGSVDAFQMQQLGSYEAAAAGTNFNGNGNVAGANYKNGYEESIVDIKKEEESFNNLSQASSCDYSMSQFRADEPPFVVKHEQSYAEEDSTMNYNDHDDDADEMNDDEEDVPLAMRKRKQEATDRPDGGMDNDDDDDIPLLARKKVKKEKIKKESKEKSKKRVKEEPSDDYGNVKPKKKKMKKVGILSFVTCKLHVCLIIEKIFFVRSPSLPYPPANDRRQRPRWRRRRFGDVIVLIINLQCQTNEM